MSLIQYFWIDGVGNYRTKNKIQHLDDDLSLSLKLISQNKIPLTYDIKKQFLWNYDGSSTYQGTTKKSEVILHPVKIVKHPFYRTYTIKNSCF
jgi:hypothetical protein